MMVNQLIWIILVTVKKVHLNIMYKPIWKGLEAWWSGLVNGFENWSNCTWLVNEENGGKWLGGIGWFEWWQAHGTCLEWCLGCVWGWGVIVWAGMDRAVLEALWWKDVFESKVVFWEAEVSECRPRMLAIYRQVLAHVGMEIGRLRPRFWNLTNFGDTWFLWGFKKWLWGLKHMRVQQGYG